MNRPGNWPASDPARRHCAQQRPVCSASAGTNPRDEGADISLINCPFHALALDYTDLVCGMNLELIGGLVETLEHPDLQAHLAPTPGRCCV